MLRGMMSKIGLVSIAIAGMISTASATYDFSGLTDLINATMTILQTFVDHSSTIFAFFILMASLGLIGIIIYKFVGVFLTNMAKRFNE